MLTTALALNMLHLMYRQVTIHFDLYPFNNLSSISPKARISQSVLEGVLMLFPLVALRVENLFMVVAASGILFLLLIKEFLIWWLPYFTQASDERKIRYRGIFAETMIVLPKIRDNPIPNLEHCILHLLNLASFLTTIIYLLSN